MPAAVTAARASTAWVWATAATHRRWPGRLPGRAACAAPAASSSVRRKCSGPGHRCSIHLAVRYVRFLGRETVSACAVRTAGKTHGRYAPSSPSARPMSPPPKAVTADGYGSHGTLHTAPQAATSAACTMTRWRRSIRCRRASWGSAHGSRFGHGLFPSGSVS